MIHSQTTQTIDETGCLGARAATWDLHRSA